METVITLENRQNWELPKEFSQDDVRYPSALVERFLTEFTQPGDVVLDPFAGYGTTLFAAEKMGRKGYGVELLPQRVEFIRKRIPDPPVSSKLAPWIWLPVPFPGWIFPSLHPHT